MTTSWLYRLGQQTAAHHAIADAQRLAVMDVTSATELRRFLERVYGFEGVVAQLAFRAGGLERAVTGAKTRIGRLQRDLLALGLDELEVAALPAVSVEPHTAASALGWLFVIERHVLLAGLIQRFLATAQYDWYARPARRSHPYRRPTRSPAPKHPEPTTIDPTRPLNAA